MGRYVIIDDKNKVIRRAYCTDLNVPDGEGIPDQNGLSIVQMDYYDKHPREGYRELGLFESLGEDNG